MAAVTLKNVTQLHAGTSVVALQDFSLEIGDRDFVVLTGPSGAGKTNVLRAIAGLAEISHGEILIGERAVTGLKPAAREVAMVVSEDALYPAMSLRENIAFGLKLRKFSQKEITRRTDDAAAALDVASLLDRLPRDLSAVQRQRGSIARAIARQPKVLLFDEPLERFDASARAQLRIDLRKLHERLQTTVIYATRDAGEAIALAGQVVVLREGRVEQSGAIAAVYDAPASVFVGGFLGVPPMNFVAGTFKADREGLRFVEDGEGTIEWRFPLREGAPGTDLAGKSVLLGIRPEDIRSADNGGGRRDFPALIDFVETVGGETSLHLQTGAHSLVARQRGTLRDQPAGRRGRFGFDLERTHLFDPETQKRISLP